MYIPGAAKEDCKAVLAINLAAKGTCVVRTCCTLLTRQSTLVLLKWMCRMQGHMGSQAFKRKLVCSVAVLIAA